MSTLKVNNLQVGQDSTATNNLTWFQPGSPDGSIRLGSGNAGSATTKFTFDKDGNLTCVGDITANSIIAPIEGTLDDWIVHAGDTDTKIGFSAANTFQIQTGGSARLQCDTDGVKVYNGRFYSAGTFAYIESSSTSTTTLTLRKTASGADSIDYLQFRNNANGLLLKVGGDGIIYTPDVVASHEGDTNTKIRFPAADKITLETSGTERFQVDANGNVYVGGVGASATAGSLWLNDTSANASKIWQDNGNSALVFGTGSGQGERLRIASDGKITVAANSDIRFTNGTWSGEVAGKIQHNSNNLYIQGGTGGIRFRHASNGANQFSMTNGGNLEAANGDIVFGTTNKGIHFPGSVSVKQNLSNLYANVASGNNNIEFQSNGTSFVKFRGTNGNVEIVDGDLLLSTSGHGIDFSAVSDASRSVQSNILDDYEEGNFNMFFWCSNTNFSTSPTMTTNNCRYCKIGNKVSFTAYLSWNAAAAGGSGNLYLGGLPFNANSYQSYGAVYFGWYNCASGFSAHEHLVGYINNNSGNIVLMRQAIGSGGGRSYATLLCSALHGGTGTFQISGTYLTNS